MGKNRVNDVITANSAENIYIFDNTLITYSQRNRIILQSSCILNWKTF